MARRVEVHRRAGRLDRALELVELPRYRGSEHPELLEVHARTLDDVGRAADAAEIRALLRALYPQRGVMAAF